MKKVTFLFGFLFLGALITKAQFTNLLNFNGTNGDVPIQQSVVVSENIVYGMNASGGAYGDGTIFSIHTDGSHYNDLFDFNGTNGANPYGSLTLLGGVLYGMTSNGGANGDGITFSIDTNGSGFTDLVDFTGTSGAYPGHSPFGSLTPSITGDSLFGMTWEGGANNEGVVFSITTSGSGYIDLHDFNGTLGSYPYEDLTLSITADTLFGMTYYGGAHGLGCIFSLKIGTPFGYQDMMDFNGTNGSHSYSSLLRSGEVLYGMTTGGGAHFDGNIFSINSHTSVESDLFDFDGSVYGSSPRGTLRLIGSLLYGSTYEGGTLHYGTIFSIHTNGSSYSNLFDFYGLNGEGPIGSLMPWDGVFYGMTNIGGVNNLGVVYGATFTSCTLSAGISSLMNVGCYGDNTGSVTVSPSGGTTPYTYLWSDPSSQTTATSTGLSGGIYTVTVTGNNSCNAIVSVTITQPAALSVFANITHDVICFGGFGSISAIASGGTSPYTYLWSNGGHTSSESLLSAGTYSIIITDNCGFTATNSINFDLSLRAKILSHVSCYGESNGSILAIASGGTSPYTYVWSGGGTYSVTGGLTVGTYTVTLTDNCGTSLTTSATITQPAASLSVSATASSSDICFRINDPIYTGVSGGTSPYTYSWFPSTGLDCGTCPDPTLVVSSSSIATTVTVTDNNGCTATSTVGITVNSVPNITISASPSVIAPAGGSSTLTASGALTYLWNDAETTSSITVTPSSTTSYSVTGTNSSGCTGTSTVTILVGSSSSYVFPPPSIDWTYTAPSTLLPYPNNINYGNDWIYSITEVHDQYGGYIAGGYTGSSSGNIGVILRFSPSGELWWESTSIGPNQFVVINIQEYKDNQGPPSTGGYHYLASNSNRVKAVDLEDLGPAGFILRHILSVPATFWENEPISGVSTATMDGNEAGLYNGFTEIIDPSGNNCGYVMATAANMNTGTYAHCPPAYALLIRLDSIMHLLTPTNDPGWSVTPYFQDPNNSYHDTGYGLYSSHFSLNALDSTGDLSVAISVTTYWDNYNVPHIIFTGWDQAYSNYTGSLFYENRDVYVQEVAANGAYDTWGDVFDPGDLASSIGLVSVPVINYAVPMTTTGNNPIGKLGADYADYSPSNPNWVTNNNWGVDLTILNNYSSSGIIYVNTQCNQVIVGGSDYGYFYGSHGYEAFQDIVLKINPTDGSLNTGTFGSPDGGVLVKQFDGIDFYSRIVLDDAGQGYAIGSSLSYNLPSIPDNVRYYTPGYMIWNPGGTYFDIVQFKVDSDTKQFDQPYMAASETYENPETAKKNLGLNCAFGFGATDDGGFVLGGNSDVNNENYIAIKLRPTCTGDNGSPAGQIDNPANASEAIPFGTVITPSMGTVTWNSNKLIQGYVEVHDGGVLTIDGATISFANPSETGVESKIVVDTGGILNIENGATLTSIIWCFQSVWDGIEVSGVSGDTQTTGSGGNSGWVNFTGSASTISFADTAIETIKKDVDSLDLKRTGGLVTATSTNFTDNYCGIKMYPNSYSPNGTYFTTCNFLTDNSIAPYEYLGSYAFAYLQGVSGINFSGCTFEDPYPSPWPPNWGDGIIGKDASFNVQYDNSATPSIFSRLYYGIYATSSTGSNVVNVEGYSTNYNQFTSCNYDIYENNINYSTIQNNTFYVNNNYGLFLDGCSGFNNWFDTFKLGYTSGELYGIIANNTFMPSSSSNVLDYNTFIGLGASYYGEPYIGEQAQGNNGNNTDGGLEFLCNSNINPIFTADMVNASSSSIPDQGGPSGTSTSNVLSQTCGSPAYDVYNDGSNPPFTYFYSSGSTSEYPSCSYNVTTYTATAYDCSESDPMSEHRIVYNDTLKSINSIPYDVEFVSLKKQNRKSYYHIADSLQSILDSGNSVKLYEEISEGLLPVQFQHTLLAKSPYLSDGVLIQTIKAGLPFDCLKNILLANAPLDNTVLDNLHTLPYTNSELTAIDTMTGISVCQQLEHTINSLRWKMGIATNDLIRYFVEDTKLSGNLDSAVSAIESKPGELTAGDLREITNLEVQTGEYSAASATIDKLSSMKKEENIDFCDLMPIIIKLKQDQFHGYFSLTSDKKDLETVKRIARDTMMPGSGAAKALLAFVFQKQYPAYIYPINTPSKNISKTIENLPSFESTSIQSANDPQFKLYPNPANSLLNIELLNLDNNSWYSLSLYDITGNKIITFQLPQGQTTATENIENMAEGFYLYSINSNQNVLQRGKLVIVR